MMDVHARRKRWWIPLVLLCLLPLGCGGGGGGDGGGNRGPVLLSSSPVQDELGVPPSTVVDLIWEQDLDPATVTTSIVELLAPSGPVPGTVTYDPATRRIRFLPNEDLTLGSPYTVRVNAGLSDVDGSVRDSALNVSFGVREGAFASAFTVANAIEDRVVLKAVELNEDGRGFILWCQGADSESNSLWATPYDTATGPGVPLQLATGISMQQVRAEVNDAGDAIVTWRATVGSLFHVWACVYDADTRTWTGAARMHVTIGASNSNARAVLDAQGRALVVWAQRQGTVGPFSLRSRTYAVEGEWGPISVPAPGPVPSIYGDLQALPTGQACLTFRQESSTLGIHDPVACRYDPLTGWGALEPLGADDRRSAEGPRVVMGPNGNILVCWSESKEEFADDGDMRLWANHFVAGSGWEGKFLLHDDAGTAPVCHMAMDGTGNTIVAWRRKQGNDDFVYARRHRAAGAWEDITLLSGTDPNDIGLKNLDLAMNSAGQAIVSWAHRPSGSEEDILATRYTPGRGWGGIERLDPAGPGEVMFPRTAVDQEGTALVVWWQRLYDDDTGLFRKNEAWGNVSSPMLGVGQAVLLQDDDSGSTSPPLVRMDRFGRGVAVWLQYHFGGASPNPDVYYRAFR